MHEPDDGQGDSLAATGQDLPVSLSVHGTLNRVFLLLIVTALAALCSLSVAPESGRVTPPFSDREFPETCRHLIATGRPCPSCGLTRSLIYAAHGNLDRSQDYHTAGLPIVAMVLVQIAMRVVFLLPAHRSAALDIAVSAGMLIAIAVLVN